MTFAFRKTFVAVLALLCLVGAGCVSVEVPVQVPGSFVATTVPGTPTETAAQNTPTDVSTVPGIPTWHQVADGAERATLRSADPAATVILYRFDQSKFRARLASDTGKPKTVSAWAAEEAKGDALALNGTYFHEDLSPSGFVAVDGERVGDRQFDLDKTGLLVFGQMLHVIDTRTQLWVMDASVLGNAAQTYPFFFSDGEPAISQDSGQVSRRTFIGTDAEGRLYAGVAADSFVSLHGLMRVLQSAEGVHWQDVLNLDGGPSTGIVARFGNETFSSDSFDAVPNAVLIERITPDTVRPLIGEPLDRSRERVTKKPFGLAVSPKDSPVSPERFSGIHVGTDFETFPEEQDQDVPVRAVCDGSLTVKRQASGYGGVVVQECLVDLEWVTVVYGHLRLSSVTAALHDPVRKGEVIGMLGTGGTPETDGERKHLHLGIHKSAAIDIRGYVQDKKDAAAWLDATALMGW